MSKFVAAAVVLYSAVAKPEKGGCISSSHTLCGDLGALSTATWWYDWSPHRKSFENAGPGCATDTKAGGGRAEFVPMINTPSALDSVNHTYFKDARFLLSYNEPEAGNNVKAADGAKAWAQIEQLAKDYNLTLVGPCYGDWSHAGDQKWEKEWQAECQSLYGRPCHYDHVCTHAYKSQSTMEKTAKKLVSMLDQMHNDLGKPIWLNEFAFGIHNKTADDQLAFMKEVLPRLDELTYLFRYSWYVTRKFEDGIYNGKRGSSLLAEKNSALSPLGEYYNTYGIRETDLIV